MPRITQLMPPPPSVSAGSTATFRLPIGRTYHNLYLVGSGTGFAPSDLSEIRVIANNKVIQRFSGAHRESMNLFMGRATSIIDADNFALTIPFDRFGMMTRAADEDTAIQTGSVDPKSGLSITTFNIEIDITSGSVTSPALAMYADTSQSDGNGPGTIPYLTKIVRDYSAATLYDWSDIPRGTVETQVIDTLFLYPSTGNLTGGSLLVEANSYKVFERSDAINRRIQSDGIRVPQSGQYVIDKTELGFVGDSFVLNGLTDFRVRFTTSAAMTITSYVQYLGALSG